MNRFPEPNMSKATLLLLSRQDHVAEFRLCNGGFGDTAGL